MKNILFIILLSISIFACSGLERTNTPEEKGSGSFITGKDEQGIKLFESNNANNQTSGLPINALLWRAALDIVSSIPIDDIDAFGGTITSEWYQIDVNSLERIKLAIFILDRELRSDGLRVIVYLQKKQGLSWQDAGTDADLSNKLEELILTRAREIRAESVKSINP